MKHMKVKLLSIALVAMMVFVVGCGKPSLENERNIYNNHQKLLKRLAPQFENFRPFMVKVSAAAFKFVEESKKETDEAKKAEKFVAANKIFSESKLFSNLSSLDGHFTGLTKDKSELGRRRVLKKHLPKIRSALSKASAALTEAKAIMTNTKPTSEEAAIQQIKQANGVLISAKSKIRTVKRQTKGKKKSIFKRKKKKKNKD